jgi:HK97 family phage major capsid protein
MSDLIKKLYAEANILHTQAKAILDEFKGKEMPAEKSQEVDGLLDEVEAKTSQAKKLEEQAGRDSRAAEQEKFLNEPATRKAFFTEGQGQGGEAKVMWNGRTLDADELAQMESIAPFKAFSSARNPEYAKALRKYQRYGVQGLNNDDTKALSVGDPQSGGYLQQDTYVNQLIVKQRDVSAMRRISTVLPPVPSGSAIAPAEDSFLSDAAWTTEVGTGSDDTVRPFGQRKLTPHPLAKRVKVSNTLLRNPFFDVEAWVRDRMAYKFAVPEEDSFVNGDGAQKPVGILNTTGLPVFTTATALLVFGDDVINWIYKLPQSYAGRPSTRILANRSFIRKVRTIAKKDTATAFTNYIWQPGLQAGTPNTILDIPYELSDRFPTGLDGSDAFTANSVVAVVGDFSYYWIVDALQMSIQRLVELYAEANQTGFIGRKETDGMAVLSEAFYALRIKA